MYRVTPDTALLVDQQPLPVSALRPEPVVVIRSGEAVVLARRAVRRRGAAGDLAVRPAPPPTTVAAARDSAKRKHLRGGSACRARQGPTRGLEFEGLLARHARRRPQPIDRARPRGRVNGCPAVLVSEPAPVVSTGVASALIPEPPDRLLREARRRGLDAQMKVLAPGQTLHW